MMNILKSAFAGVALASVGLGAQAAEIVVGGKNFTVDAASRHSW